MNKASRAEQIWPLLVLLASQRQTITYDGIGGLIGVPRHALGQLLEPIQSYCILNGRPALSSLVVGVNSGLPGEGFIASDQVPAEQAKVFREPWTDKPPPTAEELELAVTQLPSNGKSLVELLKEVSKL